MFESRISAGATEKSPYSEICVSLHGPMTWKAITRSVWNDIVSWRTKRLNNSYKVSTPCIDDHHFKEEELKSVGELFRKYAEARYSKVSEQICKVNH